MTGQAQESSMTAKFELHGLTLAQAQEAIDIYAKHIRLRIRVRTDLRASVDRAYLDNIPLGPEAT